MKLCILLCLVLLLLATVVGQYTAETPKLRDITVDPAHCEGREDFDQCVVSIICDVSNSKCYCKDKKPFCRCNNYEDSWFIGENCEQKWNTLTFALVASLPGLALAAIVGITVQCIHRSRKQKKGSKGRAKNNKMAPISYNENTANQDGAYSNMVFTSDLQGAPRPPSMQPTQQSFPMTSPQSLNYSPQRPTFDRVSAYNQPYSPQPNGMRPTFDRTSVANPSSQPYSYATGMTQPLGKPNATSQPVRNPYEDRAPPPDRYDDHMKPTQPPSRQSSMMRGVMSEFPAASSSSPPYSTPDYSSRSQFPRAQMGRPF